MNGEWRIMEGKKGGEREKRGGRGKRGGREEEPTPLCLKNSNEMVRVLG